MRFLFSMELEGRFDSFIRMTFPIRHADLAGRTPQNISVVYARLRRENLRLPVAGIATEIKLLMVERGTKSTC
jgi:hypothetical protein